MPIFIVLFAGVLAISSASILIRFMPDVPAIVIAFWRLAISTILTFPLAGYKKEIRRPGHEDFLTLLSGGFFLAVHFTLWISSLKLTTVASAVVLGTTTPIWVSIVSHFLLKEKNTRAEWTGILIAVLGGFLVGYGDIELSKRAILGDVLATVSAWAISGYFVVGRKLRKRMSLLNYTSFVYAFAAFFLLIFAKISGLKITGYSNTDYFLFILLAIFPQLIGHNALNWALSRMKASIVTLSVLGEAVISGTLAVFLFKEIPSVFAFIGYILIISGIVISTRKNTGEASRS